LLHSPNKHQNQWNAPQHNQWNPPQHNQWNAPQQHNQWNAPQQHNQWNAAPVNNHLTAGGDKYVLFLLLFIKKKANNYFIFLLYRYPAGVSPQSCPNYPFCDNAGGHAAPQVAPLPGWTERLYPAGVSAHECPNFPYCH